MCTRHTMINSGLFLPLPFFAMLPQYLSVQLVVSLIYSKSAELWAFLFPGEEGKGKQSHRRKGAAGLSQGLLDFLTAHLHDWHFAGQCLSPGDAHRWERQPRHPQQLARIRDGKRKAVGSACSEDHSQPRGVSAHQLLPAGPWRETHISLLDHQHPPTAAPTLGNSNSAQSQWAGLVVLLREI